MKKIKILFIIILILFSIYIIMVNKNIEPKKTIYNEYLDYIEAEHKENTEENWKEFLKIYNNK